MESGLTMPGGRPGVPRMEVQTDTHSLTLPLLTFTQHKEDVCTQRALDITHNQGTALQRP